jgi:Fe-S cluster assembly iron-binding protein IscA
LLALTDNAVEAIEQIVSASEVDSEARGMRVVAERAATETYFQLSVVPLPAEDDEVIEEEGARIFLDPEAAPCCSTTRFWTWASSGNSSPSRSRTSPSSR